MHRARPREEERRDGEERWEEEEEEEEEKEEERWRLSAADFMRMSWRLPQTPTGASGAHTIGLPGARAHACCQRSRRGSARGMPALVAW